jgi:hypothetical protein
MDLSYNGQLHYINYSIELCVKDYCVLFATLGWQLSKLIECKLDCELYSRVS